MSQNLVKGLALCAAVAFQIFVCWFKWGINLVKTSGVLELKNVPRNV